MLCDALTALNTRFLMAEMAMAEYGISRDSLLTRLHVEIISLNELLEEGYGGDWLTF
jgi:hypothetical protein